MREADVRHQLHANLQQVRDSIAEATRRAGRAAGSVKLVAVTKYVDQDLTRAVFEAGCHDLGESRPQQLWSKAAALAPAAVQWHLIGHLQRNKAKRTAACAPWVHSVDNWPLLLDLEQGAAVAEHQLKLLLEVNISGDVGKHGLPPDEVEPLLEQARDLSSVEVVGLMGMASLSGGRSQAQRDFARLRELRDALATQTGFPLSELSMGMSGDFDLAILEGATLVRIGSSLFEGIT